MSDQKPIKHTSDLDSVINADDLNCDLADAANGVEWPDERKKAIDELGLTGSRTVRIKSRKVSVIDLSKLDRAWKVLKKIPSAGEYVHLLLGGDFAKWELILAIQREVNQPIADLHVATLSFSQSNIQQLCQMMDSGKIRRAAIVGSHYFKNTSSQDYSNALKELEGRGVRMVAVRNHCKIGLIRFPKGVPIVIESSANLRSCQNIEQATISRSQALYDFHHGWMERVLEEKRA